MDKYVRYILGATKGEIIDAINSTGVQKQIAYSIAGTKTEDLERIINKAAKTEE